MKSAQLCRILEMILVVSFCREAWCETTKISYFIDPPLNKLAVLEGGEGEGLKNGMLLLSYRLQNENLHIPTGRLKVIHASHAHAIAQVIEEQTIWSTRAFPDYPMVMAADVVEIPKVSIMRHQEIIPDISISYFDLFKDPRSSPSNFELSHKGTKHLAKVAEHLRNKRFSLLFINGHTDHNGASDVNQIESYQRALTIKQHLVNNLGFASDRVIALGLGETEPLDETYVSGYVRNNRRIVFKIVPHEIDESNKAN